MFNYTVFYKQLMLFLTINIHCLPQHVNVNFNQFMFAALHSRLGSLSISAIATNNRLLYIVTKIAALGLCLIFLLLKAKSKISTLYILQTHMLCGTLFGSASLKQSASCSNLTCSANGVQCWLCITRTNADIKVSCWQ